MITRRTFGKLIGATAIGATAGLVSLPARAQTASSLERIKASGVLRIGGIADGAPYYQKVWPTGNGAVSMSTSARNWPTTSV
ncbi:hypothetical protein [Rhizobium sp. RCAM05973]|uniref:hypothetical protein n=1 Tax=Rhizobium sp. RCAM05973 TaxID=2994066 RepID=UPI0032B828A7